MKALLIALGIIVIIANVAGAIPYQTGSFDPVRPNQADWVCYDYAIDYAQNNIEWGVITVSEYPNFIHISHMLNYRINGSEIEFYDPYWSELLGSEIEYSVEIDDMRMGNKYFQPAYYHVWDVNQTPWRTYRNNVENIQEVL
jgi:hypothetical protein